MPRPAQDPLVVIDRLIHPTNPRGALMGLFSGKTPNFSTEAGNLRAANDAAKAAKKARRAGDHERAAEREGFAAEARTQADMSKRLGR
jgi:hypothetical protein